MKSMSMRLVNRSLAPSILAITLATGAAAFAFALPQQVYAADTGVIRGVLTNKHNGEPFSNALVILQCNCLESQREETPSENGVYTFRDLPVGRYTIQVLAGKQNLSKIVSLTSGQSVNVNFGVKPEQSEVINVEVEAATVATDSASGVKVSVKEVQNVPVGGSASRDFTDVVLMSPTAQKSAGGISVAGTTAAETKYSLDGASVNSPTMGTVKVQVVQEFVQTLEVKEAGYDAEFGGASGGQVMARRLQGTNDFKGTARLTLTPRLARPKLALASDDAVRTLQVQDFQGQFALVVSGPIIKDKLFYSAYMAPEGNRLTLEQGFFRRVDRNNDGTVSGCEYENGTADCAPGQNFIQTEQFARRGYNTGNISGGWALGLDWNVTTKHHLGLTVRGGPSFGRVSYRQPVDPMQGGVAAALNNSASSASVGYTTSASGLIDDQFGWSKSNNLTTSLHYEGRAFKDKMDLEGVVSYLRESFDSAWLLDNAKNRYFPATQTFDQPDQGLSLYQLLGQDGAISNFSGIEEACNSSDINGVVCPVRTWLSGGLGPYTIDKAQALEAVLKAGHFFKLAGQHQLKYGVEFKWLQRNLETGYSGYNSPDFYENCKARGLEGEGEWCYDKSTDEYQLMGAASATRVNNHRLIVYSADNPENVSTFGYGRVRHERGDLRAMTDAAGNGARVDDYHETLSTNNFGAFIQDKWSLRNNLYVGAGVRWDGQQMKDILGQTQISILNNVSPRLSAFYDWTQTGKSRLYASYGWFFNPMPLNLNTRVFGGLVQVNRNFLKSRCDSSVGSDRPRWKEGLPTEYCQDTPTGGGTTGTTLGAIVPRLRGPYNQQFQVGYQQEIMDGMALGVRWLHTDLGRAIEDMSADSGKNFIIGNPGEAVSSGDLNDQERQCEALESDLAKANESSPDSAAAADLSREVNYCRYKLRSFERLNKVFRRPIRDYNAWTIDLRKTFGENWLAIASYTYSRLYGNYDGMINPITGAVNVGASPQFDIPELVRNSYGPLFGDVPHRFNLDASYTWDLKAAGKVIFGTSTRIRSGAPVSYLAQHARYGRVLYLLPRGSAGRLNPNYDLNLSVGYVYLLPRDMTLEIMARLLNATNRSAVLSVDNVYTDSFARPIAGGDLKDMYHARAQSGTRASDFFNFEFVVPQANFGVSRSFQQPMTAQFDLRLQF
jgi:hypothetical protein